jgi:hypothetical protein
MKPEQNNRDFVSPNQSMVESYNPFKSHREVRQGKLVCYPTDNTNRDISPSRALIDNLN